MSTSSNFSSTSSTAVDAGVLNNQKTYKLECKEVEVEGIKSVNCTKNGDKIEWNEYCVCGNPLPTYKWFSGFFGVCVIFCWICIGIIISKKKY